MNRADKCRRFLYSVWKNQDDSLVIFEATASDCARAMGIKRNAFYRMSKHGGNSVWTIMKTDYDCDSTKP